MSRHHRKLDRRRWEQARAATLERDSWTCRTCGDYGNHADHIEPLETGGDPYALANLQCLCRSCHIEKTREENSKDDVPGRGEMLDFLRELLG